MPDRKDVSYFGAGPAPLPTEVLEEASKVILNYNDMGIGIAEISHRSPEANQILADAKSALIELLDIPNDYDVLFMQAGGSGEFSAVVLNMVAIQVQKLKSQYHSEKGVDVDSDNVPDSDFQGFKELVRKTLRLDYLVTGSWSLKASQEAARLIGPEYVNVALDARKHNDGKFGVIPDEKEWKLTESASPALTYFCDNETVDGVEFPTLASTFTSPGSSRNVVADMSSNFLSRKVDVSKYAIIFGGAQKNVGTTGVTILILRKSLLPPESTPASPKLLRKLGLSVAPVVLDYPTIHKNGSLYNTLPIFDVWVAGKVMNRLCKTYGAKKIGGQEAISNEKADMIYGILDANPSVYNVVPSKAVRSRMNICVRVKGGDAAAEDAFLKASKERNLQGLKGHRSVGGIRISNYNAVTMDSTKKLAEFLKDFAQQQQTNGAS